MSKILVISDIHLHRWNYGSTVGKTGLNSRLIDQMNYLFLVRDIAIENGVKHVFCLGDLFHTHSTVHAEVMHAAASFVNILKNNGIKFHCLVGNHDMASKDGKIHTLDWLRLLQDPNPPYPAGCGAVIDSSISFDIEGRFISALPYTEDKEALAYHFNRTKHQGCELVLLHQGINLHDNQGSAWVINEVFTKDMVPDTVKRVLTGHYHKPCDDGIISIVGSPMEHTWSDYDGVARGCIILDLETLAIERIPNKFSPKFLKRNLNDFAAAPEHAYNKFLKIYGATKDVMEDVRKVALENNARSVEFDMTGGDAKKVEVVTMFKSFDQVIKDYDESVDGRRREVGQLLRDSMYETP